MKHSTNLRNAAIRLRFPSCNYISRVNDLTSEPYAATHTSKSQLHYLSVCTKTQANHQEQKRN